MAPMTLASDVDPAIEVAPAPVVAPALAPDPPLPALMVTVITPPEGPAFVDFGELWRFRDLLYFLAWRDVKVRYKQTALGVVWAVLQPAMMMVVFTLFFRRMAGVSSGGAPYPLFAYAGLLPWTYFATAVTAAGNSVIGSEKIITKVYFPRLAVPLAAVGASAVDFLVALGLLGGLMAWYGTPPGWNLWVAPLVFVAMTLVAAGLGTILAALNVSYRDFRYVIPFLLQVGMFATPTVYMEVSGSGKASGVLGVLLTLNPMTGLIGAFRAAVLGGEMPWGSLVLSSAFAVLLFVAGTLYFRKVEDRFADII